MATWTEKEIADAFKPIWQEWLNKAGPSAAIKAFGLKLKEGIHLRQLQLACNIYGMEHASEDPKFTYTLSNFLNHDHWKDTVEATSNPEAYYKRLEIKQQTADAVVQSWNDNRKPHWGEVLDIRSARGIALEALRDQFFNDHWKNSLDKIKEIFKYKRREGEAHSKLILTFYWFCVTSPNKHTVARILEGYYGDPTPDPLAFKPRPKEPTKEEIEQARKESKEVMDEVGFSDWLKDFKNDKRSKQDSIKDSTEDGPPSAG